MFIFLLILHFIFGITGSYLCFKHYFFKDRVLWKKYDIFHKSDDYAYSFMCFICLFSGVFSIITYYYIFESD